MAVLKKHYSQTGALTSFVKISVSLALEAARQPSSKQGSERKFKRITVTILYFGKWQNGLHISLK